MHTYPAQVHFQAADRQTTKELLERLRTLLWQNQPLSWNNRATLACFATWEGLAARRFMSCCPVDHVFTSLVEIKIVKGSTCCRWLRVTPASSASAPAAAVLGQTPILTARKLQIQIHVAATVALGPLLFACKVRLHQTHSTAISSPMDLAPPHQPQPPLVVALRGIHIFVPWMGGTTR